MKFNGPKEISIVNIWALALILMCSVSSSGYGQKVSTQKKDGYFSFGVIADCQYCSEPGTGIRKYSISDTKLRQCVNHLNTMDLAFTIHLGDFIDRDWESFNLVGPIYNSLAMPKYHVLGNHDFSVSDSLKAKVPKKMGLPSPYYDFVSQGWRFVVLDGNDVSFHAYPKNSRRYKTAEKYYEQNAIESPKWNGAIGSEQMQWLRQVLDKASENNEKVILYCHFPVFPENVHNLWNAKEVVALLEKYNCVKAYINGHNHKGNYGQKNGIHYVTMKGMVDTEKNSYGTITTYSDRLEITGYGREESRQLLLRK